MLDFGIKVTEVEKLVIETIAQRKIGNVKIKTDINQNSITDIFRILKTLIRLTCEPTN